MSRSNRVFGLLVTVVLVLSVLAACAPVAAPTAAQSAATSAPATAAPAAPATVAAPGGAANTLVFATNMSDLITLDPATMYAWTGILIVHNLYQTLVQYEGTDLSVIKPGLAEKWDIKDAGDHWEVTFNLRSGAKFASGNGITADDVVYSFQRVIALKQGPSYLFASNIGLTKDSFKAVDPQTVVITLPKTASPQVFLSILTFTVGSIVDSKEVRAHEANGDMGNGWLLDHSAGSGPYTVDYWTKEVEVLLKTNPNYGATQPAVANVLVRHVLESTNQQFGLERGDIDIARNLSPDQIAALKGKPGVTTTTGDSMLLVYIGMNQSVAALADKNVREALRTAIDYDGLVNDLLKGNAKKVQTLVPQGLMGYNPDAPFQADPQKAKSLLQQAGQGNLTLELLCPTGTAPGGAAWADLAAKLQSDFANAGITINIKQTQYSTLYDTYRANKHQLIMVEWGPDFPDPDANVGPFTEFDINSIATRQGWKDAIGDKAKAAALLLDLTQREAAYKDITDYVLHNGPYAVLYQPTEVFGLRSNVKGFAWKANGWVDFAALTK
jgi:peptide/nickel transport system substrate-binding protein